MACLAECWFHGKGRVSGVGSVRDFYLSRCSAGGLFLLKSGMSCSPSLTTLRRYLFPPEPALGASVIYPVVFHPTRRKRECPRGAEASLSFSSPLLKSLSDSLYEREMISPPFCKGGFKRDSIKRLLHPSTEGLVMIRWEWG